MNKWLIAIAFSVLLIASIEIQNVFAGIPEEEIVRIEVFKIMGEGQIPLASDPRDFLGDSEDGFGFITSTIRVELVDTGQPATLVVDKNCGGSCTASLEYEWDALVWIEDNDIRVGRDIDPQLLQNLDPNLSDNVDEILLTVEDLVGEAQWECPESEDPFDCLLDVSVLRIPGFDIPLNEDINEDGLFDTLSIEPIFLQSSENEFLIEGGSAQHRLFRGKFTQEFQENNFNEISGTINPSFSVLVTGSITISELLPIGGNIIPIKLTSLLLSSTQSFSWMIPVILSGIGIGLFVLRKPENS